MLVLLYTPSNKPQVEIFGLAKTAPFITRTLQDSNNGYVTTAYSQQPGQKKRRKQLVTREADRASMSGERERESDAECQWSLQRRRKKILSVRMSLKRV